MLPWLLQNSLFFFSAYQTIYSPFISWLSWPVASTNSGGKSWSLFSFLLCPALPKNDDLIKYKIWLYTWPFFTVILPFILVDLAVKISVWFFSLQSDIISFKIMSSGQLGCYWQHTSTLSSPRHWLAPKHHRFHFEDASPIFC